MKSIVDFYKESEDLIHHRIIIVCLIGFAGFLRISELLEIHVGDLIFEETCLKIIIPKSKNDQVREGHVVYIYRSNSPYCPVTWLERYLSKTKLDQDEGNHVICRLAKTRIGHNAIGKRPIADTTLREDFNNLISTVPRRRILLFPLP